MSSHKLKYLAVAAAFAGLASCQSDSITAPGPSTYSLVGFPGGAAYYSPVAGAVKVCSFDGPGSFTTTQAPGGGGTLIEAVTNLAPNECSITWLANGTVAAFNVTVTQNGPFGFDLRRLAVIHTNGGLNQNFEDPLLCAGTMVIPTTATTPVGGATAGAVFWFKQCPPTTPPPPPSTCDFITFGRLVTELGDNKVVISGNAGGNQPGGGILAEFHVDINGVDNHVANVDTYGQITSGALFGLVNSRITTGTAKNGNFVELRVWDGGEPGSADKVYVKINGAELLGPNGQFLDQGNMQYHNNCRGPG